MPAIMIADRVKEDSDTRVLRFRTGRFYDSWQALEITISKKDGHVTFRDDSRKISGDIGHWPRWVGLADDEVAGMVLAAYDHGQYRPI